MAPALSTRADAARALPCRARESRTAVAIQRPSLGSMRETGGPRAPRSRPARHAETLRIPMPGSEARQSPVRPVARGCEVATAKVAAACGWRRPEGSVSCKAQRSLAEKRGKSSSQPVPLASHATSTPTRMSSGRHIENALVLPLPAGPWRITQRRRPAWTSRASNGLRTMRKALPGTVVALVPGGATRAARFMASVPLRGLVPAVERAGPWRLSARKIEISLVAAHRNPLEIQTVLGHDARRDRNAAQLDEERVPFRRSNQ